MAHIPLPLLPHLLRLPRPLIDGFTTTPKAHICVLISFDEIPTSKHVPLLTPLPLSQLTIIIALLLLTPQPATLLTPRLPILLLASWGFLLANHT